MALSENTMQFSSVLGTDLMFKHMAASEELGRPFEFSVQVEATDGTVDPGKLLGTPASVSVELPDGSKRFFHGLVCAMGIEGAYRKLFAYRLMLRPWLWLLTRRADTRIFQGKNAQDIIKAVFQPFSADFEFNLSGSYPTYEYCVQYRETDFNFVSRLMEQEGMYYFFKHEAGKHTMVIVDAPSAHVPCPVQDAYLFRESVDRLLDFEPITAWRADHEIQTGKVALTDYDFFSPSTSLAVSETASRPKASAKLEVYDYPGTPATYPKQPGGQRYAKLRLEELQARYMRVAGSGSMRALCTGFRFTLSEHPRADQNVAHLVVSTRIDAGFSGYESGEGDTHYTCHFTAIDGREIFRLPRTTPKPAVAGPHTARVIGESGEEITTEKHGRVLVHFHWDRLNTGSCWLRVSHPWAGKGWGMIALPRIGQEVIVDFLEGDPDRPIVTGRVYNGEQVTPYKLPDHKSVATNRSLSTKGGTTSNFNELRFEDDKGNEYVWFHAEKDFRHLVKHNSDTQIKADEARLVGGNFTEKIYGKQQITVDGISKHLVKGDYNFRTNANAMWEVLGKYSLWVDGETAFECGNTFMNLKKLDLLVPDGTKIKSGSVDIKADKIVLEATQKISMKVGGNFVVIDPSGVSINGSIVKINSGGSADAAAEAENKDPVEPPAPDLPAAPVDPLTSQG